MPAPTDDMAQRVAAIANRLRLIQIDFADQPPETRRDYLAEEVERALADLVPDERAGLLAQLMERFPTWDSNVPTAVRERQPERTGTDQRELRDPGFLIARLSEVAGTLSEEDRRVLTHRIADAGLAPQASDAAWSPEAGERLRKSLQLPASQPLVGDRVMDLAAVLTDLAGSLDQLMWTAWREMARTSAVRRGSDLRRTLGRLAGGDEAVAREQVAEEVERLRKLVAAIISAVRMAGAEFAQQHTARFSPDAVEAAKRSEGVSWAKAKEAQYWEKYCQLAATMTRDSIETDILGCIAKSAEKLMKGVGR